jgi:CBS domain-containing protein
MGSKIREYMTTDLVKLEADQPVAEAARRMRDADIGDVLVMRAGQLSGILTDRDIVVRCIAEGADPNRTRLEDVCSPDLATLSPDDDSDNAVRLMAKKAIRRVPVVENGEPVGVVSIGDLAVARDRDSALGGISAAPPNR